MKNRIKVKLIIALIIIASIQACLFNVIISFAAVENNSQIEQRTKTVEDGTYIIRSAINKKYVLDVTGPSKANGVNIQLFEDAQVDQQKFTVKYLGDGYYSITSVYSKKSLDVDSASKKNGANVQQYEANGTDAQTWVIAKNSDGTYSIISKCNGLYVDVESATAKNKTNIQMYEGNGTKAQKFIFESVNNNSTNSAIEQRKKTVEDGTYIIRSAINKKYVLDVTGPSKANGVNIQLFEDAQVDQQKFTVKYLGDGYYSITSVYSKKSLDVESASKKNGANVQQYEANGTDAQTWVIAKNSDGTYSIVSKCNGLYVDVESATAKNKANIQMYEGNGTKAQKFIFEAVNDNSTNNAIEQRKKTVEDGTYVIKSAINEKYVLDVTGPSKANGVNIQLFENAQVSQQRFKVTYLGDGYYSITSIYSKKSLDVESASKKNGANVQQYEANGTDAQTWVIAKNSDGTYSIVSKCNGLYVDVESATAKNKANIQMYEGNGTKAQKFKFEKIENPVDSIDTAKYPGYKEKIEALMEAHPDWNFELLYTGLKFDEVVAGEATVHSRNLVPTSYGGEWICSVCGTKLYDSGWYCASEKATAYYMDPRNFLDDVNVFQFQDVNEYIEGVCTIAGIQSKVDGTFLQNYATDIDNACKNQNVNSYYIIARVLQEQGSNGTTIGKGMDGRRWKNILQSI